MRVRRKVTKLVALVFLGVLLATLPGLVGCAEEEEAAEKEIVFGYLWDLTGRASSAVVPMYDMMMDYLRMAEEEDTLPVKIKVTTYDTKSDPARVVPGYVWLKGQGATMISAAPHDTELLRSRFEEDGIPFCNTSNMLSTLDSEWMVSVFGPVDSQIEVLMQWIMDTWEDYPTKPKIGFVGLGGIPFYEAQRDMTQAICELYPEKLEWLRAEMPPPGTVAWAVEVGRLKDSDFIMCGMSGSFLASFIKEARTRGYENKFIGPLESFGGFWALVKGATPPEDLDGAISGSFMPWWDDEVAYMLELKEYMNQQYSPSEVEEIMATTGPITGWAHGMILVDAVGRAVDEVGAENVDALALLDALVETNMTAEGWGNPWKLTEGVNCFAQTARVYEYNATEDKWNAISDWYRPPSLGG